VCGYLSAEHNKCDTYDESGDENKNDENDENDETDENDENENKCFNNHDCNHATNKNNKSKKINGITIKMPISRESQMNPFEMLLDHLTNKDKPVQKIEEINSDDEYDGNEQIYSDEIVLTNDDNFAELPTKIENIDDLIELGIYYTNLKNNLANQKNLIKTKKIKL
jgi:hypothetical protein